MAIKTKDNPETHNKSEGVIIGRLTNDLSTGGKKGKRLDPMLLPQKINKPKDNLVKSLPYDTLDMKSKKLIVTIDESITNLSIVNPLMEGGFGYDHPGVKIKKTRKKNDKSFSQMKETENIDEYKALLLDLKMIMDKLSSTREAVFANSAKKG